MKNLIEKFLAKNNNLVKSKKLNERQIPERVLLAIEKLKKSKK